MKNVHSRTLVCLLLFKLEQQNEYEDENRDPRKNLTKNTFPIILLCHLFTCFIFMSFHIYSHILSSPVFED